MKTLHIAAIAVAITAMGCSSTSTNAPVAQTTANAASVAFSLTSAQIAPPTLRLNAVRVVNRHPDIKKPLLMSSNGAEEATLTFAVRDGSGVKMAFETTTLDARVIGLHNYPTQYIERLPRPTSARETVDLEGGWKATLWVDDTSSAVLAQVTGTDGTKVGDPILVSPPSMQSAGPPRAITADGRHIVVTFFTTGREGFELVAAALEANR